MATEHFKEYQDMRIRLYELQQEADAIIDLMDKPWCEMTKEEKERIRKFIEVINLTTCLQKTSDPQP